MKQLLIRADDIGYSYAVNLGIARAVNEGLVRSAGLMPNMPEAQRGWDWVSSIAAVSTAPLSRRGASSPPTTSWSSRSRPSSPASARSSGTTRSTSRPMR